MLDWREVYNGNSIDIVSDSMCIATVWLSCNTAQGLPSIPLNGKEHARLIAAAPKLLEALEAIVERCPSGIHTTDQETGETFCTLAKAAISSANGAA